MSDPMSGEWARLDESPTASAQMIQWYAPETFRVVTEATEAQIRDLLEEREELLTEIRRLRMGNHPAGRALERAAQQIEAVRSPKGLTVTENGHLDHAARIVRANAAALAEALTERDAGHEGGGGA